MLTLILRAYQAWPFGESDIEIRPAASSIECTGNTRRFLNILHSRERCGAVALSAKLHVGERLSQKLNAKWRQYTSQKKLILTSVLAPYSAFSSVENPKNDNLKTPARPVPPPEIRTEIVRNLGGRKSRALENNSCHEKLELLLDYIPQA